MRPQQHAARRQIAPATPRLGPPPLRRLHPLERRHIPELLLALPPLIQEHEFLSYAAKSLDQRRRCKSTSPLPCSVHCHRRPALGPPAPPLLVPSSAAPSSPTSSCCSSSNPAPAGRVDFVILCFEPASSTLSRRRASGQAASLRQIQPSSEPGLGPNIPLRCEDSFDYDGSTTSWTRSSA